MLYNKIIRFLHYSILDMQKLGKFNYANDS